GGGTVAGARVASAGEIQGGSRPRGLPPKSRTEWQFQLRAPEQNSRDRADSGCTCRARSRSTRIACADNRQHKRAGRDPGLQRSRRKLCCALSVLRTTAQKPPENSPVEPAIGQIAPQLYSCGFTQPTQGAHHFIHAYMQQRFVGFACALVCC